MGKGDIVSALLPRLQIEHHHANNIQHQLSGGGVPILGVVNQKGGCAKSTTSIHLAYWLQTQGHSVTVIDADAQRSSSIWLQGLLDTQIPYAIIKAPKDLLHHIPKIAVDFAYCIVDGPAGLSQSTQAILACADLAIIPCQPTGVDLRSAADAIKLVRKIRKVRQGLPKAKVLLSRAVKGTRLKDEAIAVLNKANVPTFRTVIHQRQAVADTFGQGATVFDLAGASAIAASAEFEQLGREVVATVSAISSDP
jgi:chromosome partitioning protein